MSSDKARIAQKRRSAWVMFAIMFGGVFTASGFVLYGSNRGPGSHQPPPLPEALPPVFQGNLSSFDDALRLVPETPIRVAYTGDRGLSGTDLGTFVAQRHAAWTQVYGTPVSAEVRILLSPTGLPLWLHAINGPGPRAPPTFTYRNATLVEFFPGQQPWLGITTNTQPVVAGVRPPGRPGPPYLVGLDEVFDVFEGRANRTARDLFEDLSRRLPPGAQFAGASAVPAQGWDNRSVFGVLSEGNERYLMEAYLAGPSPDIARLRALQANATSEGVPLVWDREAGGGGRNGDLVRIEARGNWSQVRDLLSAGGFLPQGA